MNISDEQLSAFIDNALPESEMDAIREAIALDEALSDRLSELMQVDLILQSAYGAINDGPLPEALTTTLENHDANKVVSLHAYQAKQSKPDTGLNKVGQNRSSSLRAMLAFAASLVLVTGLGLFNLLSDDRASWQQISQVLTNEDSGVRVNLAERSIRARMSFIDQRGAYCRVFETKTTDTMESGLACKVNGEWQEQIPRIALPKTDSDEYQTASGAGQLDDTIQSMLKEGPFNQAKEREAIADGW